MAIKLSEEDVQMWLQRIQRSKEWRKAEEDKWKRFIGYAQGKYNKTSDPDYIAVNLVHAHVRIIIPAIYSKNPDIIIVPRRKDSTEQARVMEVLLRYLIEELGLKGEMKTCLLDAVLTGHSWMKVGFQVDTERVAEKLPVIQKVADALGKMLRGEEGGYEEAEKSTYYLEPDERIISERPWALRVSPFDVIVPAYSSNRFELPWITHQFVRRLSDVKKNPKYKNTSNLTSSSKAVELLQNKATNKTKSGLPADEHEEYVLLYEVWDCTENCVYTLADEHDLPLAKKKNEFTFLDSRHPFEMLGFNFIPDQFYPISEIEPWEPQIEELNQIRTQQSIHRKRYNRRYIYAEGAFSPDNLEALKNGEDGALVATTADDVRAAIQPIMDAPLPADVYQAERWVKEDIVNIGGITDYQRGSSAAGAKTATEASIIETQSRFRTEERLDVVGDFATRIIRNLGMIAQNFMDQEMLVPIIGDDAIRWVQVDKKMIQGEMLFKVAYGSTAAVNRDVEKQQLIQAYELIAQDPMYNQIKVRMEFLRKALNVVNPVEWLDPEVAAMVKQMELQAIQDMMATGPAPGVEGGGNGKIATPGVGGTADRLGGIRRALSVRTPGGLGGGRMNE